LISTGANLIHLVVVRTFFVTTLLAAGLLRGTAATSPPFSIQQRDGNSWFIKPNGQPFFSLGVCVVNEGVTRERFNATNPGYAAFQHYENSNRWAEATLKRLRAWKFTTVGNRI
jgi:hypothetical protein